MQRETAIGCVLMGTGQASSRHSTFVPGQHTKKGALLRFRALQSFDKYAVFSCRPLPSTHIARRTNRRNVDAGVATVATERRDLTPGRPRQPSVRRGGSGRGVVVEFNGKLPDGIEPAAHGLPLEKARRFLGDPQKIEKERDRFRVLWTVLQDAPLFKKAVDAAVSGKQFKPPFPDPIRMQRVCEQIEWLRQAIAARQQSFQTGLATGNLRAFAPAPKNRALHLWISPTVAADHEQLARYQDVFVADTVGIPGLQAIRVFCAGELNAEMSRLESHGALYLPAADFEIGKEWYRLEREGMTYLAECVRARRLIASRVEPDELTPDAYSGKLPIPLLHGSLFRLPLPAAEELNDDTAVSKPRRGGRPPKYDWPTEVGLAAIHFRECDLRKLGQQSEIAEFLAQQMALADQQPAQSELQKYASKVMDIIRRSRNVR